MGVLGCKFALVPTVHVFCGAAEGVVKPCLTENAIRDAARGLNPAKLGYLETLGVQRLCWGLKDLFLR